MTRVGIVGLGKMGISHLAIARAHPDVELAGVCDSSGYLLSVLGKYTGLTTYSDMGDLLDKGDLDAVIISTPSAMHAVMVEQALERGIHVFCEKPFCLKPADSARLTALAAQKSLVTQVGYHYRYVGAFSEVKKLLDAGAIGRVTHVLAEAYGPVVLAPRGGTWRSRKSEGGGSLYDYAAHPLNLLNWYLGEPTSTSGTLLRSVFSAETEDEVYGSLTFADGATAQISVNWSDESQRKMTTKMTLWGTQGRIEADRQEIAVFLRAGATVPRGYEAGWNVKYTTELTEPVWYYLRGEEYSAQVADFVHRVSQRQTEGLNSFSEAAATDRTLAMLVEDASSPSRPVAPATAATRPRKSRLSRLRPPWRAHRRSA